MKNTNRNLDQEDKTLIDEVSKIFSQQGMTLVDFAMFGETYVTKNIKEALEKHRYRQVLPLLGDEQKEQTK